MQTSVNCEKARPLLILGHVPYAADLALRRVLHAKENGQALVVIDYQGNLASHLTEKNKGNLHKGPLLWCDVANRRRPSAMFRFQRSPGMKPALRGFLETCARHMTAPISLPTIDAVVELAYRLTDQGNIGLAALVRSLKRPETSHSLKRNPDLAAEVDHLIGMLDWALRFPSVWGLSEGNNFVDLDRHLSLGGTTWIEIPGSHFERLEHQMVSWMVDAALMNALLSRTDDKTKSKVIRHSPVLMYGFPNACPLPVTCSEVDAKHVGLFPFSGTHPLPTPAKHWLEADADCWVAGAIGELPPASKTTWFDEVERDRLQDLRPGQVWVRSGANRKAVTALVRPPEGNDSLAHDYRRLALKRLRLTPIKQFSSALTGTDLPAPKNADLYRKLCSKDTLYVGWFRVKSHNGHSHGADHITIDQFGARLDVELDQLAQELMEGRYRCRPLRTARVPKSDGDFRVLRIACVRDRVVQAACLHLIDPLFDVRFSRASFAYRPGRGAHHAVAVVRSAIRSGKHWVVTADIKKCFDTIDHEILLRLVGDVIGDHDLVQLIRQWLVADVIDFMDVVPSELGVPQGEAISPLLANIYLDSLDKEFEQTARTFVRYADDYVVLCNSEAEAQAALRQMGEFLQGVLRMTLKAEKTQYRHVTDRVEDGIGFLGFQIALSDVRIPPDKVAQAIQGIDQLVQIVAQPDSAPMDKYDAVSGINSRIRGFRNYFLIDDAPTIQAQLQDMDRAVDAVAAQRFSSKTGTDLAWQSREHFGTDMHSNSRQSQRAAEVSILTGAYPLARPLFAEQAFVTSKVDGTSGVSKAIAPVVAIPPSADSASTVEMPDLDVLVIDGRLHVMTSGCFVTVNADDVIVRRRKTELLRIPIAELTMVYLEGKGIGLSADLTMRLCDKDVPVVFTPLVGVPAAIAQPVQSTRSNVRQQQVLRRNDPDILKIGLAMLAAKVANQASVLKYFARYRKRTNDPLYTTLTGSADEIRSIADTLDEIDPLVAGARACAMGYEGRAAAKYWSSFANLIPEGLSFPGRHTRHATDAVNSAVNYIYGMLYGEVWRAAIRAGLDPYFGIIHGTERDQGSLIFDLIEEYRAPFGDRLMLGMFGRGFELVLDKDGRLRAAARQKLVRAFHKQWQRAVRWRGKMRAPSEILDQQATSLKNAYLGSGEYRPFRFQW